jgi:hypothetical protein
MGLVVPQISRIKLNIAAILAYETRGVSVNLIAQMIGEDPISVQEILIEWEPFLLTVQTGDETWYTLYHDSFREFLSQKTMIQAAYFSLRNSSNFLRISSNGK